MSTIVRTSRISAHVDPGVALGPRRYNLKPTEEELIALRVHRNAIMEASADVELSIVTHYHYDHHPFPDDSEMYRRCFLEKTVIAKDISKDIHQSGKKRGELFRKKLEGIASTIEWGDSRDFEMEDLYIRFSPPVWHGDVGSRVGKVLMVYFESGNDSFLYGSDAQGLADPNALEWSIEVNPRLAVIDGYPTLFVGWRTSKKAFEKSKKNLKEFIESTDVETIVMDHHIVRDLRYKEKISDLISFSEDLGKKLITMAEFLGVENLFLEAWRKEIHNGERKVDLKKFFSELSLKSGTNYTL